ncbi:MAG: dephospho-CoA kinase [Flavobacteriaceae bacterium]|nr:dephospho-CoA kinase [Flavobacteriaceae bacterium]
MTLIIGLTGGIGSGKTTVAKLFKKLAVPIYFMDLEAKKLMQNSKIIKRKLIVKFGQEVYLNNKLNRSFLANIVFSDTEKLKHLESIVHPKVKQHFKRWVKKQNTPYVLQENAILFENGNSAFCDFIITVTAPLELKIDRVIKRDAISKKEVIARMNNQWTDEVKIKKSNFIIKNVDLEITKKEVLKIHKKILTYIKGAKNFLILC